MPKLSCPLVLLSGMAADERVFESQRRAFEQLIVPTWPVPLPRETLNEYARRIADEFQGAQILVLGGASFGGIVALHVAQFGKPRAILSIGSVASPRELPKYVRYLKPLRSVVGLLPIRLVQRMMLPLASRRFKRLMPNFSGIIDQFVNCDSRVLRWSIDQVLSWDSAPDIDVPILHIHGDRDWLLPLKNTTADRIVRGGGHLISMTHTPEVNDYIREIEESCRMPS